ncbi:MAG: MaoC family dehydratase [Bacillota bacterium]|uniref:Enoyl-CoA hydratase n=1 Tax=Thermanaerosceptrum fracticalcis TaxID=1712410 RepID=A0A7G6E211_THEFR|nr:MaoC family dehydratase [Thermanaerosceptrum fracticalcis]QNB46115.1 enoyl-CoA hydratase [Thermanaerosceptrum fracticalcis]
MYKQRTFSELKIGMKESMTKKITKELIGKFAEITDDYNPVHVDEEYAKDTMFGKNIAHGMLSAGLISAVLGTKLPGPGNLYMSQELKFRAPVFIDDVITAWAEIIELNEEKHRVKLATWCENQDGKIVIEGTGMVYFDK